MKSALLLITLSIFAGCTSLDKNTERSPAGADVALNPKIFKNKLKPFVSDGCAKPVNGIDYPHEEKWRLCCVAHDIEYWRGGTHSERQEADRRLRNCIIDRGEPEAAALVWAGVRAGGSEILPTPWRWGYGWLLNRGKAPLTAADFEQIKTLEAQIPRDLDDVALVPSGFTISSSNASVTGDYCVDTIVSYVQNETGRSLNVTSATRNVEHKAAGYFATIKVVDKECAGAYEFKFWIRDEDSCTRASNSWVSRVRLISKDLPELCQ